MSFYCCCYSSKSLPFVDDNFRDLFTFYNRFTAAGALSFFFLIRHKWDITVKLTDFHWTVFSVSKIQKRNQPAYFIYIKVQKTSDYLAFYFALSTLWMLKGLPQPKYFPLINFFFVPPFLSLNIRFQQDITLEFSHLFIGGNEKIHKNNKGNKTRVVSLNQMKGH